MKCYIQSKYGKPTEVLKLSNTDKPTPKENEVLIKVKATAINDYDWSMTSGKPGIYRLMFGLSKPKFKSPGMELSGIVEEIGTKVDKFKIGDEVFGDISDVGFGTFTEYVCVHQKALIHKPSDISFEEATAIPHASTLAYQALLTIGEIKEGQKVLINGAGGGVGSFAIGIAKRYNCEVTGVDSNEKLEMLLNQGYDRVLDYKSDNFTNSGEKYDLILDCKSSYAPSSYLNALSKNGHYVTVGGKIGILIRILLFKILLPIFGKKKLSILALKPNEGLNEIIELYQKGQLKCNIDGPYNFNEIPQLIEYFGAGKHKGKIVIKL